MDAPSLGWRVCSFLVVMCSFPTSWVWRMHSHAAQTFNVTLLTHTNATVLTSESSTLPQRMTKCERVSLIFLLHTDDVVANQLLRRKMTRRYPSPLEVRQRKMKERKRKLNRREAVSPSFIMSEIAMLISIQEVPPVSADIPHTVPAEPHHVSCAIVYVPFCENVI